MEIVIGYLIVFAIQFALCYGILFGHLQGAWPKQAIESKYIDRGMALLCGFIFALLPFLGPFIAFCVTECGRYGLRYK